MKIAITLLLFIIVLLLGGIGILLFNRLPPGPASESAGRAKCLENQKLLENAIIMWAAENGKSATDFAPQRHDLNCPSGGRYSIGTVADEPRCSIQSHDPQKK